MENVQSFIEELCDNTANTILTNHRLNNTTLIPNTNMINCINNMVSDTIMTCKDCMVRASMQGKYEAVLWEGTCRDVYMDYNALFLIKGPRHNNVANPRDAGLAYFDRRGIIPMILQIREYLAPLPVLMTYNHNTRRHQLVVYWNYT